MHDVCAQAAAKAKGRATLRLVGSQAQDETSHLWGTLAGQTSDVVLLGVHSDGQNAVEENGLPSLALMARRAPPPRPEHRPS